MPFFNSFDNAKIHYIQHEGDRHNTFIFLHGWTSGIQFNEFLIQYLKDFNIIMWDARCHGKSRVVKNATVTDMAKDLHHFLTQVYEKKGELTVIGHSMGALILLDYVKETSPLGIDKMVLIDISPKIITDAQWKLGIYGNFPKKLNDEMIKEYEKDLIQGHYQLGMNGLNKEFIQMIEENPELLKPKQAYLATLDSEAMANIWRSFSEKDYRGVKKKLTSQYS